MVERRTWEEFREAGLLWWVNRALHLFGWAICCEVTDSIETGTVLEAYPARVKFRGFDHNDEAEQFKLLTRHIADIAPQLVREVEET
jgi:hypothetical protein